MKLFHRSIKIVSLSFFFLFLSIASLNAQGWSLALLGFNGDPDTIRNDIIQISEYLEDTAFAVGITPIGGIHGMTVSRIQEGNSVSFTASTNNFNLGTNYSHYPKSILHSTKDTLYFLTERVEEPNDCYSLFLSRFYGDGIITHPTLLDWHLPVFSDSVNNITGQEIIKTQDDHILVLGSVQSEVLNGGTVNEIFLVKTDVNGNVIWTNLYGNIGDDNGVQVLLAPDGGFWLLKNSQANLPLLDYSAWLMKLDANGTIEWEQNLSANPGDEANDLISTADGGLAITGQNANEDLFVLKVDMFGNLIWRQDYPAPDRGMVGRSLIEDSGNHLVVVGQSTLDLNNNKDAFIAKLAENGTPLWERFISKVDKERNFNDIKISPDGQYLMAGSSQIEFSPIIHAAYFVKTDTFGIIKGAAIHGNVFYDLDLDCLPSPGELNLEDWKVQAVNDTLNFFTNTDAQGNYWLPVDAKGGDTYNYIVSVIPPNEYWEACNNDIMVSLNYLDTLNIDFPIQALVECPFMEYQVGMTRLRPCEQAQIIVQYCNSGTDIALNASFEIELDPFMTFNTASITPSQINGQLYTFPLGDVDINECGNLNISVFIDCDTVQIGDELCINTNIYPDTLCMVPGGMWSGALLQLNYDCVDNEIQYSIENVGTGNMIAPLEYIIIEDAVLLQDGDFNLMPTQVTEPNPIPINGSIYHLISPQEPGAPGAPWISLSTSGCPNGGGSVQIPQYNGNPFSYDYCQIVVGSFDPNDKQASPEGFGESHNILPNTDLEYTIRFQNTGTDTAFRVIIRDTLSWTLNPATVVPGPSSHPYDWRLDDAGILTFSFYNIALPDSSTNFAGSQGFVKFKVAQQVDLPVETSIENDAAIYFDFNPPIITNETFHRVGSFFDIINGSINVANPNIEVRVIPNPMEIGAWIEMQGLSQNMQSSPVLHLFDVNGREVVEVKGENNRFWLERGNLQSGMYFFSVEQDGAWLASGKVVVQ